MPHRSPGECLAHLARRAAKGNTKYIVATNVSIAWKLILSRQLNQFLMATNINPIHESKGFFFYNVLQLSESFSFLLASRLYISKTHKKF